ncbi:activating transcription factor 7-interacting protein 1-like [Diretmus argenteus]
MKQEPTKIARLAKKFGEANQVSENKRKQEALAAAAAAAAATAAPTGAKTAAAAAATATTTAATAAATAAKTAAAAAKTAAAAAKTAAAANTPPAQRGTYNKNIEMESFWSEEWGLSFFNTTMHRNRYREIMRYLRSDKKESRHIRLSSDKFALMSEVWETFVNNSIACYKPGANITVDKQILPTKARCRFTQYMANEPDKFSITFWLAADVNSKYVVNGFPYLGKDENRPAHQHLGEGERGDEADGAILPPAQPTPAPTSTATVTQSSILQLITSSSKAVTTLATGITTQTPTGTLLLKTAAGSNMMGPGQPLLIQLPLSMTNGQTGTLVNFPVSSLSAASSLNKGKTTTTTTTYILKPAPIITVATSSSVADTVSALQASTGQMSSGQISLARVVYSGGTGGINTPKAGVSVTAARTPAQSVSAAGAMSSASSPATSGPAATGSTAPGPPQGTSMTSKTVAGARSSPQSNLPTSSNPQLTVHHRPPLDSPIKSRAVSSTTPTRASTISLPPLPSAPAPPGRLPPEAAQTSPPQQPQLKLVPSQTGIVLLWCVSETDRTCATVDSYHLYAFHQDNSSSNNAAQQHWKKIGEVEALPLPMTCTLTQFQSGSTYHFAVRAKDIYGRLGSFCEPQWMETSSFLIGS